MFHPNPVTSRHKGLSQIKIGARLGVALAVVLGLLAIMIFTSIFQAGRLQDNTKRYEVEVLPSFKIVHEIDKTMRDSRRFESQFLLLHDDAMIKEFENRIAATRKHADELLSSYEKLIDSDEDRRLYNAVKEDTANYWKAQDKILDEKRQFGENPEKVNEITKAIITGDSFNAFTKLSTDIVDWWAANEKLQKTLGSSL